MNRIDTNSTTWSVVRAHCAERIAACTEELVGEGFAIDMIKVAQARREIAVLTRILELEKKPHG